MEQLTPIAETNNFIILDKYTKIKQPGTHQTEPDLERELIEDLNNQGYEYRKDLNSHQKLLANVREQLERLNKVHFSEAEWGRFVREYLDAPAEGVLEKSRKVHHDHVYDFVFDDGRIQNIYLLDKKTIQNNRLQVIHQFKQTGIHSNRYDVTILVNGLPLVHIELKKRGVVIREAFNQIHRYSKESFNSESSLFKYVQIFVISNGTDTRYFANTTKRDKNSFDFTINWAKSNNETIKDLKDFTATFFSKHTLLSVLLRYSVFDVNDTLLLMRPYQIAATERILQKITSTHLNKIWNKPEGGGYIWHTTGSGKTLTSFKAARLATELPFIDKVFFVVDRKDLDYQTMKEYQRFSPDSVNGSESTAGLKRNIEKDDNKIIVTTIQKLNNLMKSEDGLAVYQKAVVFIFDECHRSQFGEAQKNLRRRFKKFCQFGFTGTPIFPENASGAETTAHVFGRQLHEYVITDAIRDEKVLKFKVDYNDVRPKFKDYEKETDLEKLSALESKQALLHPQRLREIAQYVLNNFAQKTHRFNATGKGFNAMFAVSSVDAAKQYYEIFKDLQSGMEKPLKIATIFSFAANEEQKVIGEIEDENFEPSALNSTAKEFLQLAIDDYNAYFKTNFGVESDGFQNYYRDLAKRVKGQEVDLLIVVGMFLTGFDAPCLNTLFVDKNLRYHGLIQAFSRTNRILDKTKAFGNIVAFRDLEKATADAITLFGNKNKQSVILEKSYREYMEGFKDEESGEAKRGYVDIVQDLKKHFPDPSAISTESDKKEFVALFGEYLRVDNVLQNYDEYVALQALQSLDKDDAQAVEAFKERYYLDDQALEDMAKIPMPSPRAIQDYRSTYNDIRDWLRQREDRGGSGKGEGGTVSWDDVVFEIELLKSQEIDLDYILGLLFENHKKNKDKDDLIEEVRRMIRASVGNRAKESLIVDFIRETDLEALKDKAAVIEAFFLFARQVRADEATEIITENGLKDKEARRFMNTSLKREFVSENGTGMKELLPVMSPLNPKYLPLKQRVLARLREFVEKFKGVGGEL